MFAISIRPADLHASLCFNVGAALVTLERIGGSKNIIMLSLTCEDTLHDEVHIHSV